MTRRELEVSLENRCVVKIEARGGAALKLSIPGVRGFPDRTVLIPPKDVVVSAPADWVVITKDARPPRVFFAEFKRLKTGKVSAQQHRWRVLLHQMGFGVYTIDTDAQFDEALEKELAR